MSSALKKNYGFTVKSCLFLDKFASPLQEEFVNESSKLIDSALPRYEKEMHTAARLILDYEQSFWDTIYKYSIISNNASLPVIEIFSSPNCVVIMWNPQYPIVNRTII
jgi:hypothetical protein